MEGTDAMTVKQDHVLEWLFSTLRWEVKGLARRGRSFFGVGGGGVL